MSISLDGYVADARRRLNEVFDSYTSGDIEIPTGGSDPMTFKVSEPSTQRLRVCRFRRHLHRSAHLRRRPGLGGNRAWGPHRPHSRVPAGWARPGSTVHLVTDGIDSAVSQAEAAAAGKSVGATVPTPSRST